MTFTYNLRQNICRFFHVLAQFLFTASETKLDYYHQKVTHKLPNDLRFRKLENFKKMPKMLGFDGGYPAGPQKATFRRFSIKNSKKAVKYHIASIIHKIFKSNSSFHVKNRSTGKV